MSRIGKLPLTVPAGVEVTLDGDVATVKGPKGQSTLRIPSKITVSIDGSQVVVDRKDEVKQSRALHGTIRNTLKNMVLGVKDGYVKELEIQGVGYKAVLQGNVLVLSLGFSHEIKYEIPKDIKVEVTGTTDVKVSGHEKAQVGQVASRIRAFSPAEPYKGKGVRYKGEQVRRKEGKAVA
ncbi:MAG: 50S ribosomal protein L6 [Kiritimatiellales bacterium]|jgi:large subunit ribosomal protein L6|nr:50S ribosomal protein L6 [Kiritimatiellales bacterium]